MTTATTRTGSWKREEHEKSEEDQKLRRDRWTAIVIWAVMTAVMALVVWLAILSSPVTNGVHEFWPMMP